MHNVDIGKPSAMFADANNQPTTVYTEAIRGSIKTGPNSYLKKLSFSNTPRLNYLD